MSLSPSLKIMLINPPRTLIGSRFQDKTLAPLSLTSLKEALTKTGFDVVLYDADEGHTSLFNIVRECRKQAPQYVMLECTSSSSQHATVMLLCAMLKFSLPHVVIMYGGMSSHHHQVEVSSNNRYSLYAS